MIQEEERKQRIIWISADEIRKIIDDFPFYLMTEKEFQDFKPKDGAELTLRTRNPEKGKTDKKAEKTGRKPACLNSHSWNGCNHKCKYK